MFLFKSHQSKYAWQLWFGGHWWRVSFDVVTEEHDGRRWLRHWWQIGPLQFWVRGRIW